MALIPATRTGKVLARVWVAACVAVLVFAYLGRGTPDTDILVAVFLTLLCFPISLLLSAVLVGVFYVLLELWGINVRGGLLFNVALWLLFVSAGYLQWYVFALRRRSNAI